MTRMLRRIALAAAAVLVAVAPAAAQDQPSEFESWQVPGWTFTPGVVLGTLYDSNVAIAFPQAPGARTASDSLFQMEPFGQLEYLSPRTSFFSGYRGFLRRYFTYRDLDSVDQRGYLSLRERLTRRVTFFFNDSFLQVPTTDQLELNGVPFQRTGSRYNAFAGGIEARLTRSTDFNARYDLTWVDFQRKDTLLTGGTVNGVHLDVSHHFTERATLGAEYGIRLAALDRNTRLLTFQETGLVARYRTGPDTSVEIAGGLAHLLDRGRDTSRSGPYVRAGLMHRARRATIGIDYERSYVPSFVFGGTNQSQEARGYIQMPLSRNRFYVQESAAWRRTDPFLSQELPLDSIWLHSVVGYALQRWFRVEAYHAFTRQDTRLAGGQINRNMIGVQFVVSQPVRIQ
jgi:hypothetical protein